MKCLLVVTHPLNDSLCKHLSHDVAHHLAELGHDVIVEDLYSNDFSPALSVAERTSYYDETYHIASVQKEVQHLREAEALVLVFPTWWFGFPAMLKGWFDRVWGPGIAYRHADDYGPIQPQLHQLKRVMVVTTLGSPWWVDRLVLWQPVKRVLKTALLGTCAPNSRLQFLSLYNSEKATPERVTAFKGKIRKAISQWQ